ncbi:MAG: baseplate J/gp47 family protein [Trueperaceae bacterium]|nr:baseplate J/gp47 family protein [Trueperaceae bacterium]
MSIGVYSNDAQLREEDSHLFGKSDTAWTRKHIRAAEDIRRDLKRHGYLQEHDDIDILEVDHKIVDDSAEATVELEFTAESAGQLVVPKGTRVTDGWAKAHGKIAFVTDEQLTVPAGGSDTVAATAADFGECYNVPAGELTTLDGSLSNFDGVTHPSAASGGADHQLSRAAVYRTLELVYTDLMREEGDSLDARRKLHGRAYMDELERMIAAGIDIDVTGDNVTDHEQYHGFHRFRRG